ncbi:MAG: hypothetical protein C3F07_12120 [Anaerolineales bacterium]|nr:hypothetical protein [Anaerolineae bacterium]PWB72314.1 MAG: hypothetical protein C3F07_12120 [Anaerolineales bacterium]
MKNIFRKSIMIALVAALAVASLPLVRVAAAAENDPPSPSTEASHERLERIWARQLRIYERIGNGFERADTFVDRVQELIDRAAQNDKDVSAVQAALDAFEAALKEAHPVYESGKGLVNSHQGFDNKGKVTDPEKAKETVKAMGEKLREIKEAMDGTGRALHDALRTFREANPPPQPARDK